MKQKEPSFLELLLTRLAFALFGKRVYRDFAERLTLKPTDVLLDFGSGMGTVAYYAAQRIPQGHLVCADVSGRWRRACEKTLRRFSNVSYVLLDADYDALPSGFDVIYCHFVLHELNHAELDCAIARFENRLNEGGRLVFREPLSESAKLSLVKRLLEQSGMKLQESRIRDIPYMGNVLESIYRKTERRHL